VCSTKLPAVSNSMFIALEEKFVTVPLGLVVSAASVDSGTRVELTLALTMEDLLPHNKVNRTAVKLPASYYVYVLDNVHPVLSHSFVDNLL